MTGSLTPQSAGASDDLGNASYKVTGTGTANDAHRVPGVTLIDPTTGLPYAASGGSGGGGGGAVTLVDGADVTQGASTDTAASLTIMGRILKFAAQFPTTLGQKLSAASLGVVIASDQSAVPVSGTVTANAGSGTQATSNSNLDVALSTRLKPADTLTAVTTVGAVTAITNPLPAGTNSVGAVTNTNLDVALSTRLKPADTLAAVTTVAAVTAITNALPTGANTIGAVTNANLDVALSTRLKPADTLAGITTVAAVTAITNALPAGSNSIGAVTNANLDVALSTRLKPADTLAAVTTVGAVTAITNALPAGTNAIGTVGQKSQITATTTMQNAANANGNGTVVTTDGYNGALLVFISNSTGTATVTIEGSLDSGFVTAQDVVTLGVYKLADSGAGTNTSRSIASGAIAVAASTSYLYAVADSFPYIRARISGQASLAALTVKCYAIPS